MQTQTSKMWPIVVTDEVHQALVALKQHPTEPFHVVIARLLALRNAARLESGK